MTKQPVRPVDLGKWADRLDADTGARLFKLIGRLKASATGPDDPVRTLLGLIGDRWSMAILMILGTGVYRYADLQRAIRLIRGETISQRMLTLKVRQLERNGLVSRNVMGRAPLRVDYALTDMGNELLRRTWALMEWIISEEQTVRAARRLWSRDGGA